MRLKRLARQPWLHFLLLGVCLFWIKQSLINPWAHTPQQPLIYPPSEQKIAQLRGQWLRSTGHIPTQDQLQQLISHQIDQEILFQEALRQQWHLTDTVVRQRLLRDMQFLDTGEGDNVNRDADESELIQTALAMGLHQNDLVIRRRLIQRMEMQAQASVEQQQPTEQWLRQQYQQQAQQWRTPALISFSHIYISRDRNADAKRKALDIQQRVTAMADAGSLSEPFLHGLQFTSLTESQVMQYFGAEFTRSLFQWTKSQALSVTSKDNSATWSAPISSSYGEHLVRVEQFRPASPKPYNQVRAQLIEQWRRLQQQQALKKMLAQLRERYRVVSDA